MLVIAATGAFFFVNQPIFLELFQLLPKTKNL